MTIKLKLAAVVVAMTISGVVPAWAQAKNQVIPIYDGTAPGTEGWQQQEAAFDLKDARFNPPNPDTLVVNVTRPTLTVFRPAKPNGTAVIVAPGGGFRVLSYANEGVRVAQWLNARGITAFVLKYRLNPMPGDLNQIMKGMEAMAAGAAARGKAASEGTPPTRPQMGPIENGAVVDGQEAVKLVRRRAAEFAIDPAKIGIIGFSAGGAVSGGAAVNVTAADRPNFVGIIYSFTPGEIPKGPPPAFMAAAADDPLARGMPEMFTRWLAAGAPAELHIYAKGQHGFGTAKQGLPVDHWLDAFHAWMGQQGFIPSAKR